MGSPSSALSHISIGARDCKVSEAFYSPTLTPLGLRLVFDSAKLPSGGRGRHTLGYGPDEAEENEILTIFEHGDEAHPPGRGCHIAFNAASRSKVDQAHAAAISTGGKCDGRPGLREHYGGNYYAAFIIDPDGWRLEVVSRDLE